MAFVRQRHGLPRGDLDRIVRQQAYMASLVSKILSTNMLQGGTLLKLQDAAKRSLTLDSSWDLSQLAVQMWIALAAAGLAGRPVRLTGPGKS